MKRLLPTTLLCTILHLPAQTPFTYQGRLENNGAAYTGTVHIRLGLYAALTGGTPIRTEVVSGVTVTGGVFTVTPVSFTSADFPGTARFMNIEISSDAGATYTLLTPRQQVTWTPYALTAGNAATVSGSVPAAQITGTLPAAQIGGGTTNAPLTFGNGGASFSSLVGTPPFHVSHTTKVPNLNSDLFDGLDSTAFLQKSGGTMTGALGIDNGTTVNFGNQTRQMLNLYNSDYGIGVQANTQYFRTAGQFAWFKNGTHSDVANNAGSGGTTVMTLSGNGTLTARGSESGVNVVNRNNSAQEWAMYSRNNGGVGQLAFWNSSNGSDVVAFSPNGDMYLVGEISTTVMTIRGGADVAEPFEMTNSEEMDPGTVVVIDEDNAGHLMKSTKSYDKRVAGIISGAGGVKPGLRLHQEGVMEGDHHVALSGRVYVKADASFGKDRPGDLLTTSSTPGHAMKAKDYEKARGAILGKAMSNLDKGTGLVLVLVTLQ